MQLPKVQNQDLPIALSLKDLGPNTSTHMTLPLSLTPIFLS